MADGKSVLIVDDEPGMLMLFGGLIERLECDVLQADGGETAIALLQAHTPDVLVLDLAMPHVSGGDVLAYVQQTPRLRSMRILVLTALGINAIRGDLPDIVDKWVNKPLRPDVFLALVRELLDRDAE